jgi:2-dehydropantoate 2-reductase
LVTAEGEEKIAVPATTEVKSVRDADIVIVQCKSLQTEAAIASAAHLFGSHTVALTFQNGLGNEDVIAAQVGAERVLAGLTMNGAAMLGPGVVKSFSNLPVPIGEFVGGSRSKRAADIATAFSAAGVSAVVSPDIMREKWAKLLLNVGLSATSAITGMTIGQMMGTPVVHELVLRTTREALQVARAAGHEFTLDDCVASIMKLANDPSARLNTSSSSIDLSNKKPTEVEFINGAIVRIGREHGVPTPINETQVSLVHALENLFLNPIT